MPVSDGRRGNPVLWSRRFFKELMTLDGDVGARHLIAKHAEAVAEVPVEGQSAFLDIDTPQALEAARAEGSFCRVGKAQRAHHSVNASTIDGAHGASAPFALHLRSSISVHQVETPPG